MDMALHKSGFITEELDARLKAGSDKIRILNSDLLYYSRKFGLCRVPACFESDGSSVPRLPIIFLFWGDRAHREGFLHDWAFRKDSINPKTGKPFTFMEANALFLESMGSRDKSFAVRYPMYAGVVVGSYPCFHKRKVTDKL